MSEAEPPNKTTQDGAVLAPTSEPTVTATVSAQEDDQRMDCFLIMPFSSTAHHNDEYWNRHFVEFLSPLVEEHPKLKARRSEALRGDIGRDIITSLVNSPVVVAELTDLNPNVFWELGVRQSFKHGTVTIAEEGTVLPFDIITKGTLFYRTNDHIQEAEFRRKFKAALADCLSNKTATDSSVLETISGRGSLYTIIRKHEILRRLDAVISEWTHNTETLKLCGKMANLNLDPACTQIQVPYVRLRLAALEHLLIERYLDADYALYEKLERILGAQLSINNMLSRWERGDHKQMEELVRTHENLDKAILEMLAEIRMRLESSR